MKTNHLVIHCDTETEKAKAWNKQRNEKSAAQEESNGFSDKLFDELVMRFETPIGSNRWDSPLIALRAEEPTPLDEINKVLIEGKPREGPNSATTPQQLADTNFMFELDRITNDIVNTIISAQQKQGYKIGDEIDLSSPPSSCAFEITMTKRTTIMELRKLRTQFVRITQMHPPTIDLIAQMFLSYLDTNLSSNSVPKLSSSEGNNNNKN